MSTWMQWWADISRDGRVGERGTYVPCGWRADSMDGKGRGNEPCWGLWGRPTACQESWHTLPHFFLKSPTRWIWVSPLSWWALCCAVLSHSVVSDSLWLHGLRPARLLCPWDSPGKNTGVGCHALLQGIFPTQGLNPGLPPCRRILYHLSHQGSPMEHIGNCY